MRRINIHFISTIVEYTKYIGFNFHGIGGYRYIAPSPYYLSGTWVFLGFSRNSVTFTLYIYLTLCCHDKVAVLTVEIHKNTITITACSICIDNANIIPLDFRFLVCSSYK